VPDGIRTRDIQIDNLKIGMVAFQGLDLVYEVDSLGGATVMAMVTQLVGP
jgi:hypothetical protein